MTRGQAQRPATLLITMDQKNGGRGGCRDVKEQQPSLIRDQSGPGLRASSESTPGGAQFRQRSGEKVENREGEGVFGDFGGSRIDQIEK